MEVDAAVLRDRAVVDGGGGVIAVGLLEIFKQETGREVGLGVELVVQAREVDVLSGVTRERAEQLFWMKSTACEHWVGLTPEMVVG